MRITRAWFFVLLVAWSNSTEASLEEALTASERTDGTNRAIRTEGLRPRSVASIASGSIPCPRQREHDTSLLRRLRTLAIREAEAHKVPAALFLAVVEAESSWDPSAHGKAHEIGLVQVLPATYRDLRDQGLVRGDPWHPQINLHAGAVYLHQAIEGFTKEDLRSASKYLGLTPYAVVAAAYNAGPQAVKEAIAGRRQLPASTRVYAQTVRVLSRCEKESMRKEQWP